MPPTIHRWTDLPRDNPMPLIERRRIIGEHMMISEVFLHEGFAVPTHHHANEQIAVVLSGRIRFVTDEGTPEEAEHVLEGGQVIVLPPNLPHRAEALEDTRILDLFSPPSQTTGVDTA